VGYASSPGSDCALCEHRNIKWLFAIQFAASDVTTALGKIALGIARTEEVTISPVGSKCITDWLDAVPESAAKLEALKRWKVEMDKCKAAQVAKVVEDLCAKAGYETPEAAYEAFCTLPNTWGAPWRKKVGCKVANQLKNNALRVKRKKSTRSTVKQWLENLAAALAAQAANETGDAADTSFNYGANESTPAPADPNSTEGLRARAQAVLDDSESVARLKDYERRALADIRKKVGYYKSFATSKQKNFFVKLILKGEKDGKPGPAPTNLAKPGDENYASPSGIEGARY
jgi:hypothetical protein